MTEFEQRLNRLMYEAISQLKAIGIRLSASIVEITENTRAKKRLGCCKEKTVKGRSTYTLEISTMMQNKSDQEVKEVIFHELLHTCPGCLNHGVRWKQLAGRVNEAYGCHITTTAGENHDGINQDRIPYRYKIRCTKCGRETFRLRRSKVIDHPELYRCRCGGILEIYTI